MDEAKSILKKALQHSNKCIVCGFSKPPTKKDQFLLLLDQRFTSHYPNFVQHKKNGYMEGLLGDIQNIETISTFDPTIAIYFTVVLI